MSVVIACGFVAADGTRLDAYTPGAGDIAANFVNLANAPGGQIESHAWEVGRQDSGAVQYQVGPTMPVADYTIQFDLTLVAEGDHGSIPELWVTGRALPGLSSGYQVQAWWWPVYGLYVVPNFGSGFVAFGPISGVFVPDAGVGAVLRISLIMQGSAISLQVQRLSDGAYLVNDGFGAGMWQSDLAATVTAVDTSWSAPGTVIIGTAGALD